MTVSRAQRPTARILLVRHGRSGHQGPAWHTPIDTDGFAQWRAAYDAAGVRDHEQPPLALRAMLGDVRALAASDLPRARASVALLGGAPLHVSELLREVDLPGAWRQARLPLAAWLVAARVGWLRGTLPSAEPLPLARRRAEAAARWLVSLAPADGTLLVVTHVAFRPLLAAALHVQGWRGRGGFRYRHWSVWALAGPPAPTPAFTPAPTTAG